jgi:hypothetical protein
MSIFDKDVFTLNELCIYIKNNINKDIYNINEIYDICNCYILFTNNNNKYWEYVKNIREYKGYLLTKIKDIYLREILQIFDIEFTKLVIRIKTNPKIYNVLVSWKEFEDKIGIEKNEFRSLINKNNIHESLLNSH